MKSTNVEPKLDLKSLELRWRALDNEIRTWWDKDVRCAREAEIRDPEQNKIWYADEEHREREAQTGEEATPTLLYLPFPFISPAGNEVTFPEMYCWDTYFINLGLATHERYDRIRQHIQNQLFLIERYGMVLNANRTYYLGRSQTPLHPLSVRLDYERTRDDDFLARAYVLLKAEFLGYWKASHHHTKTGLATNRDLTDPGLPAAQRVQIESRLRPELAAEAEVLDFTAIFEGDVRQCNPLQTNCALVQYANLLGWMAEKIGWMQQAAEWQQEAANRADAIRKLCWNEEAGFFFEYNFVRKTQLPYWSLAGFLPMWAGIATREQAKRIVQNLGRFEHAHGLTSTDKAYPSPHPEFTVLQWDYPNGWPTSQMLVIEALESYGYTADARRIARKYLALQLDLYDTTGKLWEKYNVIAGNLDLPRERYPVVPMHGWSSTSIALLGRKLFGENNG